MVLIFFHCSGNTCPQPVITHVTTVTSPGSYQAKAFPHITVRLTGIRMEPYFISLHTVLFLEHGAGLVIAILQPLNSPGERSV